MIKKGVPTFADLGYTADLGLMHRVLMAPRGIPKDRLEKLQSALVELQKHKTYKRLIKAIGENTDYVNGPDYESQRAQQSKAYQAMVKALAGK